MWMDVTRAPTLWPRDTKSRLIGKDFDAGKDWGCKLIKAVKASYSLLSCCAFEWKSYF